MLEKCQNGKDDEDDVDDYQFSSAGIILAALHKSPLSVHLPHPSHHCRACRDNLARCGLTVEFNIYNLARDHGCSLTSDDHQIY